MFLHTTEQKGELFRIPGIQNRLLRQKDPFGDQRPGDWTVKDNPVLLPPGSNRGPVPMPNPRKQKKNVPIVHTTMVNLFGLKNPLPLANKDDGKLRKSSPGLPGPRKTSQLDFGVFSPPPWGSPDIHSQSDESPTSDLHDKSEHIQSDPDPWTLSSSIIIYIPPRTKPGMNTSLPGGTKKRRFRETAEGLSAMATQQTLAPNK